MIILFLIIAFNLSTNKKLNVDDSLDDASSSSVGDLPVSEDSSSLNDEPLSNDSSSTENNDATSQDGQSSAFDEEKNSDYSSSVLNDNSTPNDSSEENDEPQGSDSTSVNEEPIQNESSSNEEEISTPQVESSSANDIDTQESSSNDTPIPNESSSNIDDATTSQEESSSENDADSQESSSSNQESSPNETSSNADDVSTYDSQIDSTSIEINESTIIDQSSTYEVPSINETSSSVNEIPSSSTYEPLISSGTNEDLSSNETFFVPTETPTPDIIIDETIKDNELLDLNISNGTTASEEISSAFASNTWKNETCDQVIQLGSNIKDITLNLTLSENQYIAPLAGTTITIDEGNLNLILPPLTDENQNPLKVVVDTSKNVNLSIKGGGKLEIQPKDETIKEIKIVSKSELSAPLEIEVSGDVDTISFSTLNLHQANDKKTPLIIQAKNGDKSVPIIVNRLEAQPNTIAELTNISVSETFAVTQSASIILNNVDLKEAEVLFNMRSDSTSHEPMLQGNLTEPPKRFVVNRRQGGNPPKKQVYKIIRGRFNCDQWKDRLSIKDSGFNQKQCNALNNNEEGKEEAQLLEEIIKEQELSIQNDGKKKLSGGQIAGIVIGCVAAVAIIVIIVICIVHKKKQIKYQDLSITEGDYSVQL